MGIHFKNGVIELKTRVITNLEVSMALNSCIEERWKPRAAGLDSAVPCALCHLFDGGVRLNGDSCEGCRGCPMFLVNGGLGCGKGSGYSGWLRTLSKDSAKAVLADLEKAKEIFFKGWD